MTRGIQIQIQSALDRFMDLGVFSHAGGDRIPKGKIGAYCPECWKPYRSARWIAMRRVQRHAKRVHKLRLALSKIPTERITKHRIPRKPKIESVPVPIVPEN